LLVALKARGLAVAPELAVGDGAMGHRTGARGDLPRDSPSALLAAQARRCAEQVPKSVQPNMKADLREVRDAPDRATAEAAIAVFAEKYGAKYPKAVDCLTKDRDALLAFFNFPAEHWDHLRTANPIESVFATVRHRTVRTKGALSPKTARIMVFKLVMAAAKTWRPLKGENRLPQVIAGVTFTDGIALTATADQRAA
jgi:putative transposase